MTQYNVISKHSGNTLLEGCTSLDQAKQAALEWWCRSLHLSVYASELKGSWIQFWEHGTPTWEWVSEWSTLERIGFVIPSWCIAARGSV